MVWSTLAAGALSAATGGMATGLPGGAVPGGVIPGDTSSANARNSIMVVPTAVNLGEILQPFMQGAPANGGSGLQYSNPFSLSGTRLMGSPNPIQAGAGAEVASESDGTMLLVVGGLAALGVVTFMFLARRR